MGYVGETEALTALLTVVHAADYAFVTPTPATIARVNARPGNDWADDLRGVLGWSRPFRDGAIAPAIAGSLRAARALVPHADGWRSLLRVSTLDDTAFLHSAFPTDAADAVFFGPDTYRFAAAIRRLRGRPVRRAVDLCCGSGPGAMTVARLWPHAEVLGVDINDQALRLARANAAAAGTIVTFMNGDLLRNLRGQFDLIVANPPYMADPAGRAYRDGGGPFGASLSIRILDEAIERLAPGGLLLLYTGAAVVNGTDLFRDAATARLTGSGLGWRYSELDPDVFGEELVSGAYAGADRIAAVVLTVQQTGGTLPCPTAA